MPPPAPRCPCLAPIPLRAGCLYASAPPPPLWRAAPAAPPASSSPASAATRQLAPGAGCPPSGPASGTPLLWCRRPGARRAAAATACSSRRQGTGLRHALRRPRPPTAPSASTTSACCARPVRALGDRRLSMVAAKRGSVQGDLSCRAPPSLPRCPPQRHAPSPHPPAPMLRLHVHHPHVALHRVHCQRRRHRPRAARRAAARRALHLCGVDHQPVRSLGAVVADALALGKRVCTSSNRGAVQPAPQLPARADSPIRPPPTPVATCHCPPSRPAAPRRLARCRLSWRALCRPVSCGSTTPPPRAGQMLLTWQSRRFARRMPRPCESGHGAAAP